MDKLRVVALLGGLYLIALVAALAFAGGELLDHVLVYVFIILFALSVLGGVYLFDLEARTTRRDDPSLEDEAEKLWPSASTAFLVGLLVAGTVLLTVVAAVGLFANFPGSGLIAGSPYG